MARKPSIAEEFKERLNAALLRDQAGDLNAIKNVQAAIVAAAKTGTKTNDATVVTFTDGSTLDVKNGRATKASKKVARK